MEYNLLPGTDIKVSKICLGTMTWGRQNSEIEGHQQMDYALDKGVNFFDTAELYPIPPRLEEQGDTERFIGSWFKRKTSRLGGYKERYLLRSYNNKPTHYYYSLCSYQMCDKCYLRK